MPDYQVEFRCDPHWACEVVTARDRLHAIGRAWRMIKARRAQHFDRTKTTVTATALPKQRGPNR